jgi:hypothetical protein
VVSGDATITSTTGGGAVTSVRFATRATNATSWYELGEDATPPFAMTWATDPWVPDGSYQIKAEAWNGGVLRATGVMSVTVANQ